MLTALAVVLVSIWMIATSQGPIPATLTLIVGLAAGILAIADLLTAAGIIRRG